MSNMFTVRHTTYNLRGTHMLTLSKPRTTTFGLHSFSCFSAQQWNDLPDELKSCTFNDCKRRVQSLNTFDWFSLIFVLFCVYFFSQFFEILIYFSKISAIQCSYSEIRVKIKVMHVFSPWGRNLVSVVRIRNSVLQRFFLKNIYENFVGTLETVHNRQVSVPRGSTVIRNCTIRKRHYLKCD